MSVAFDVDFARRANSGMAGYDTRISEATATRASADATLADATRDADSRLSERVSWFGRISSETSSATSRAGLAPPTLSIPRPLRPFDQLANEAAEAHRVAMDANRILASGTRRTSAQKFFRFCGFGLLAFLLGRFIVSSVQTNSVAKWVADALGLAVAVVALIAGYAIAGNSARQARERLASNDRIIRDLARTATTVAQQDCLYAKTGAHQVHSNAISEVKARELRATAEFTAGIAAMATKAAERGDALDRRCPKWDSPFWSTWKPSSTTLGDIPIGGLLRDTPVGTIVAPCAWTFPGGRGLTIIGPAVATNRIGLVTDIVCRLLATIEPGKARFRFFDPVGLGQSIAPLLHLGDHDENLVGTKVWTEPAHIEGELANITAHVEMVIQKYLRGTYSTIEDHNRDAGEVAEPYLFPTYFDAPAGLTETAIRRLTSVAEGGARCGVYPITLIDPTRALPYGVNLDALLAATDVIQWVNGEWRYGHPGLGDWCVRTGPPLRLEVPPPGRGETLFSRIVMLVGGAAREASVVEVANRGVLSMAMRALAHGIAPDPLPQLAGPVDSADGRTWWQGTTRDFVSAPIGRAGASQVQCLSLGRGTTQHALIAGLTGSGKSSLLHAIILNLAMLFSPSELELYLLDFKKGVEFKPYATERLPHARVIAIESEREFGLSVLEGLDAELARRGEMFRAAGTDDLGSFRDKSSSDLPRILMVIDEFHELFSEDDQLANKVGAIIDRLVRQGRSFGIHLILGSQSLAGLQGITRATLGQIGVRIALQCDERDSMLILAEDNVAARSLTRPGEAIYNASRGTVDGNIRFQTSWLPDEERQRILNQLRARADAEGLGRSPIVFEGTECAEVHNVLASLPAKPGKPGLPTDLWIGEPLSLADALKCTLHRQAGSSLAIVGPDSLAAGLLLSSLASALRVAPTQGRCDLIDFTPLDVDLNAAVATTCDGFGAAIRVSRSRQLEGVLAAYVEEIRKRIESDDVRSARWILVLHQLQRARDLDADSIPSYSGDDPSERGPSVALAEILRDGPEVGVHTVLTCDTFSRMQRRLGHSTAELGLKIGFQMSASDSQSMFESEAASRLKRHQAYFLDENAAALIKFRPFGFPG